MVHSDELTRSYGTRYGVPIFGNPSIFTEEQVEHIEHKAWEHLMNVLLKPGRAEYTLEWKQSFLEETAYYLTSRELGPGKIDSFPDTTWEHIRHMTYTQFIKRAERMAENRRAEEIRKQEEAIRREQNKLKVGDQFSIEVNQGWREAEVLAVIGEEALVEYEMPNGTTALRIVDRYDGDFIRSVSYTAIARSRKWLKAMVDENSEWICRPQGTIRRRLGKYTWERCGRYPGMVREEYEHLVGSQNTQETLFDEEGAIQ